MAPWISKSLNAHTGQADEIALVGLADLGVETSQTQGGARNVDEGDHPADLAEAAKRPFEGDQRRRHTEGDHVRQRVVLGAEGALGVGQASHAAVQSIEDHGHEDSDGGVGELAAHAIDDGVEAGKQGRRGEQVGQQVDTAVTNLPPFGVVPFFYMFVDGQQAFFVGGLVRLLGTFTHGQFLGN